MTTALVLDDNKLKDLKKYAESNFITYSEMKKIVAGDATPVGDRYGYECCFHFGYRVVFSIEELPLKDGGTSWFRHISVSHADKTPDVLAISMIAIPLGFPNKDNIVNCKKCTTWIDEVGAINLLCDVKQD